MDFIYERIYMIALCQEVHFQSTREKQLLDCIMDFTYERLYMTTLWISYMKYVISCLLLHSEHTINHQNDRIFV